MTENRRSRFMDGNDDEISIVDKSGKTLFGTPPSEPPFKPTTAELSGEEARPDADAEFDADLEKFKKLVDQEKVSRKR